MDAAAAFAFASPDSSLRLRDFPAEVGGFAEALAAAASAAASSALAAAAASSAAASSALAAAAASSSTATAAAAAGSACAFCAALSRSDAAFTSCSTADSAAGTTAGSTASSTAGSTVGSSSGRGVEATEGGSETEEDVSDFLPSLGGSPLFPFLLKRPIKRGQGKGKRAARSSAYWP